MGGGWKGGFAGELCGWWVVWFLVVVFEWWSIGDFWGGGCILGGFEWKVVFGKSKSMIV